MILLLTLAAVPAAPVDAPRCRAGQLVLSLDARSGAFDGMSHSGTLLILRNRGARCRIGALPVIGFEDRLDHRLPALRAVPAGLHPGPVIMPVTLARGSVASTPLRWVSGDVFDAGRCLAPARIAVTIGSARLAAPIVAHLCGPRDAPVRFEQPPLRPGMATGAP